MHHDKPRPLTSRAAFQWPRARFRVTIGPARGSSTGHQGGWIVTTEMTRRGWMAASAGTIAAGAAVGAGAEAQTQGAGRPAGEPFGFALNTSTISGQKVPLEREIEIVAEAGYSGIEPWTREMEQHVKAGGSLVDLGKKARDLGVEVVDVIGFFEWAVDDDARREKGLEQARRDMERVRQLGGSRIAAPPFGATEQADLDLRRVAERYRALLEIGDGFGVTPLVEVWGFSKPISRLGEAAMVAIESGHPRAAILADVYHVHKGGSGFGALHLFGPDAIPVIHMNDYPDRPREALADADRVYPGDGVAPLAGLFQALRAIGFRGHLSLELFNRDYWKEDPSTVARTGLAKMKAAVRAGLA